MTMVVGCRFQNGVVIIADSRVTWETSKTNIYSDSAQKILYLSKRLAIAFAGRVDLAKDVVNEIRKRIGKNPKLRNPKKLSVEISRVTHFYYQKYLKKHKDKNCLVSLVLGGVETSGDIFLWAYEPSNFTPKEIKHGYVVIGSGIVVAQYLKDNFEQIATSYDSLKNRADALIVGLESELQKHGVDTVGGLFQVILLSSRGIFPMEYGFMDLIPEGLGVAKEISMFKGTWTQKNLRKKKELKLVEPKTILRSFRKENRFHNYEPPQRKKKSLRWYLNYFITCLKVDRQVDRTKFEGVLSQVGFFHYPINIPILVSLGFWGPRGNYILKIYIDYCTNKIMLYESKIHIEYPSEQEEIDIMLNINIQNPGPIFLECYIDNYLLGRRALFFGKVKSVSPTNREEFIAFKEKFSRELVKQHRECSDPELKDKVCFLNYFIICESCSFIGEEYEFIREMRAVFWQKYPLHLKLFIASAFRFSRGEHNLRVDLVNAATRETNTITSTTVKGTSECIVTPVYGEFVVKIPEPGVYFFNLYVDDQFLSSILLAAETDKPKYSYSLSEEDLEDVGSGELLILVKRSQVAK